MCEGTVGTRTLHSFKYARYIVTDGSLITDLPQYMSKEYTFLSYGNEGVRLQRGESTVIQTDGKDPVPIAEVHIKAPFVDLTKPRQSTELINGEDYEVELLSKDKIRITALRDLGYIHTRIL